MKKLFTLIIVLGMLFVAGNAFALGGYHDAVSHDDATVAANGGDITGVNQGYGSHYGFSEADAEVGAWTFFDVTADTEAGASGFSEGQGSGYSDFQHWDGTFWTSWGLADSNAESGVESYANSDTSWRLFADEQYNRSYVEGEVYQFNRSYTFADIYGGYADVGARNNSGASYNGVDYGSWWPWDTDSAVNGGAGAYGNTEVGAYTEGNYSEAWGNTYSESDAFQTGWGSVNAYGGGNIGHLTIARDSNIYGSGIAYTHGDAAYSYNNNGFGRVSGAGGADTFGVSWVNTYSNGISTSAYSTSSSWAN